MNMMETKRWRRAWRYEDTVISLENHCKNIIKWTMSMGFLDVSAFLLFPTSFHFDITETPLSFPCRALSCRRRPSSCRPWKPWLFQTFPYFSIVTFCESQKGQRSTHSFCIPSYVFLVRTCQLRKWTERRQRKSRRYAAILHHTVKA